MLVASIIDPGVLALYWASSIAGLAMVVGGMWLLYREKIYIDRETNSVTEVETPLGKFKTNVPALALFVLGFVPLMYPMAHLASVSSEVNIRGSIKASQHPVLVYAAARREPMLQDGEFRLAVPLLGGQDYRIIYVAGNTVVEDLVTLQDQQKGEVSLKEKVILLEQTPQFKGVVAPVPAEFR